MVGSSDFGHIPIFDGEIPHSQRLLLKSNMWNLFGWSTCPKHKTKLWCSNSHHFPPFFGCVQFLSVSFRVFFFPQGYGALSSALQQLFGAAEFTSARVREQYKSQPDTWQILRQILVHFGRILAEFMMIAADVCCFLG
jgi:hypothetical protein